MSEAGAKPPSVSHSFTFTAKGDSFSSTRAGVIYLSALIASAIPRRLFLNPALIPWISVHGRFPNDGKSMVVEAMMRDITDDMSMEAMFEDGNNTFFIEEYPSQGVEKHLSQRHDMAGQKGWLAFDRSRDRHLQQEFFTAQGDYAGKEGGVLFSTVKKDRHFNSRYEYDQLYKFLKINISGHMIDRTRKITVSLCTSDNPIITSAMDEMAQKLAQLPDTMTYREAYGRYQAPELYKTL